ncbi:hypothetical protein BH10PLA1_BH10PLA1_11760 [soil metagenome]
MTQSPVKIIDYRPKQTGQSKSPRWIGIFAGIAFVMTVAAGLLGLLFWTLMSPLATSP